MNLEDEQELKDAVDEAKAEFWELQPAYHEAEQKLFMAEQRLREWFEIYG